jgi:hypothetical protein
MLPRQPLRFLLADDPGAGKTIMAGLLITSFGATRLRMEMDRVPLWRGDHVAIKQLVDDFGRYLCLPRLKEATVLLSAVRDGCAC